MGDPANPSRSLGEIRLVLRPEWTASAYYAERVAAVPAARQQSTIYRLEPGFLIQGRLHAGGVAAGSGGHAGLCVRACILPFGPGRTSIVESVALPFKLSAVLLR